MKSNDVLGFLLKYLIIYALQFPLILCLLITMNTLEDWNFISKFFVGLLVLVLYDFGERFRTLK